jgi:hypothetical protein
VSVKELAVKRSTGTRRWRLRSASSARVPLMVRMPLTNLRRAGGVI